MEKYRATMYAHRLIDWQGEGPGLTGSYDCVQRRLSDLALFHDRDEAEQEAQEVNACAEMAPVEVVEVTVEITIGGKE